MVHVYHVYSMTGGRVGTGGGVVMVAVVEEIVSDVMAVATGDVPSGHTSGGMT